MGPRGAMRAPPTTCGSNFDIHSRQASQQERTNIHARRDLMELQAVILELKIKRRSYLPEPVTGRPFLLPKRPRAYPLLLSSAVFAIYPSSNERDVCDFFSNEGDAIFSGILPFFSLSVFSGFSPKARKKGPSLKASISINNLSKSFFHFRFAFFCLFPLFSDFQNDSGSVPYLNPLPNPLIFKRILISVLFFVGSCPVSVTTAYAISLLSSLVVVPKYLIKASLSNFILEISEECFTNAELVKLTNLKRSMSLRAPNRSWKSLKWHLCEQRNIIQSSLRESSALNPRKTT
ncbi:hypothetical protein VNO77_02463 [Canavalia gladiata]|uniref:Uncharacterized protein n=1 Tax=Canavalia gladiata TaxID=3824 RepID=A0AAN9RBB6_CANGL